MISESKKINTFRRNGHFSRSDVFCEKKIASKMYSIVFGMIILSQRIDLKNFVMYKSIDQL